MRNSRKQLLDVGLEYISIMLQHADVELLLHLFERNTRVNGAVPSAIPEADLAVSDGRGGWSVG